MLQESSSCSYAHLYAKAINKLLTCATSKQLLFLLLTGKASPGKAPIAEVAPVTPAAALSEFGGFSELGNWAPRGDEGTESIGNF